MNSNSNISTNDLVKQFYEERKRRSLQADIKQHSLLKKNMSFSQLQDSEMKAPLIGKSRVLEPLRQNISELNKMSKGNQSSQQVEKVSVKQQHHLLSKYKSIQCPLNQFDRTLKNKQQNIQNLLGSSNLTQTINHSSQNELKKSQYANRNRSQSFSTGTSNYLPPKPRKADREILNQSVPILKNQCSLQSISNGVQIKQSIGDLQQKYKQLMKYHVPRRSLNMVSPIVQANFNKTEAEQNKIYSQNKIQQQNLKIQKSPQFKKISTGFICQNVVGKLAQNKDNNQNGNPINLKKNYDSQKLISISSIGLQKNIIPVYYRQSKSQSLQQQNYQLRKQNEDLKILLQKEKQSYQELKEMSKHEHKLVLSIQKMYQTISGEHEQLSLKNLWKWIKTLPK